MKKFLLLIAVVLLVAFTLPTVILAESATEDYKQSQTYLLLEDFIQNNPDRTTTANEQATANYLANKFAEFGYNNSQIALQRVPFEVNGYETVNVVVHKDNSTTTESIVIGAHFDSVGEGANDNASGIVALLQIARAIKNVNLPFDVYFVAFGGEEQGLYGSQYFVQNFSRDKMLPLTSIRLMINIDSIANGDNLYVHCENKQTELANFILQNKVGNATLLEKPHAVGVFNADVWGYGYYEDIQGSDHTPFRVEGIPVASFFSGNFKNWSYVESVNPQNNTLNTALDVLSKCNQEWIDKIDTVSSTVIATVINGQFDQVSTNARNDLLKLKVWYNFTWPKIIAVVIIALLALFAVLFYRKLQKQALMNTAQANTTHVFETPSADDIFTFKD